MTDPLTLTMTTSERVPAVRLYALLPARDGTGWYVVQPNDRQHRCSTKGCTETAVVYYHAVFAGPKHIWKNKYHCPEHMHLNCQIRHGRLWVERSEAH